MLFNEKNQIEWLKNANIYEIVCEATNKVFDELRSDLYFLHICSKTFWSEILENEKLKVDDLNIKLKEYINAHIQMGWVNYGIFEYIWLLDSNKSMTSKQKYDFFEDFSVNPMKELYDKNLSLSISIPVTDRLLGKLGNIRLFDCMSKTIWGNICEHISLAAAQNLITHFDE